MFPGTSLFTCRTQKGYPRNFDMKRLIQNAFSERPIEHPQRSRTSRQNSMAKRGRKNSVITRRKLSQNVWWQFVYDDLWRFMMIRSMEERDGNQNKMSHIVLKCRKMSYIVVMCVANCRDVFLCRPHLVFADSKEGGKELSREGSKFLIPGHPFAWKTCPSPRAVSGPQNRHRVWLDEEVTGRNEVTTTLFYIWPLWYASSFSGCEWAHCHGTLLCEFSIPKCGGVLGGNDQNRVEKQNVVLTWFRPVIREKLKGNN